MGDRWHGMAWHGILAHWHMGGWGKRKWEMRENGTPTDVPKPAPPVALTACLAASSNHTRGHRPATPRQETHDTPGQGRAVAPTDVMDRHLAMRLV